MKVVKATDGVVGEGLLEGDAAALEHRDGDEVLVRRRHVDVLVGERDAAAFLLHLLHQSETRTATA